jgi:hypothetical protein
VQSDAFPPKYRRRFGQRETVTSHMDRKETVYELLDRRQRELTHEIAALSGEIDARKTELAHVESAKRQIDLMGGNDAARFGKPKHGAIEGVGAKGVAAEIESAPQSSGIERFADGVFATDSGLRKTAQTVKQATDLYRSLQFKHLTIKELIIKALNDHFANGATAGELREFIRNAYGRDIDRSSLTPQLSRLKDEGDVDYFQRDDEPGTKFVVVKSFKSNMRRFPVGTEIVIPDNENDLRILTLELEPRDLEDLKTRRWIVAPGGSGYWRLARPNSDEPKLIEGKPE